MQVIVDQVVQVVVLTKRVIHDGGKLGEREELVEIDEVVLEIACAGVELDEGPVL